MVDLLILLTMFRFRACGSGRPQRANRKTGSVRVHAATPEQRWSCRQWDERLQWIKSTDPSVLTCTFNLWLYFQTHGPSDNASYQPQNMDPEPKVRVLVVGTGGVGTMACVALERSGGATVTAVLRSNYEQVKNHGFDIESCDHGKLSGWRPSRGTYTTVSKHGTAHQTDMQ